jgi:predicted 3-demethylubiquinone-9 3-methyltransferase (glyoxalase superfamily)
MQVTTLLMFEGTAEAAMQLYVALFPGSTIVSVEKYGPGGPGREGSIRHAVFELQGTRYRCIDSPVHHEFSFTPSISICVDCDTPAQFEQAAAQLGAPGKVLMPAADYGFSKRFTWVQDRFGVSWQLNLP